MQFVDELPDDVVQDRRIKWSPIVSQLRKHPGQWAQIHEGKRAAAQSLVSRITNGEINAFKPAAEFEAKYTAGGLVFARWVGKGI